MKTMLFVLFVSFAGSSAFASECTLKIGPRAGMANEIEASDFAKIARIMTRKGYQVVETEDAAFTLKAGLDTGLVCGTGFTTADALFRSPGGYDVTFSGASLAAPITHERQFQAPIFLSDLMSSRELFAAVRSLPKCE